MAALFSGYRRRLSGFLDQRLARNPDNLVRSRWARDSGWGERKASSGDVKSRFTVDNTRYVGQRLVAPSPRSTMDRQRITVMKQTLAQGCRAETPRHIFGFLLLLAWQSDECRGGSVHETPIFSLSDLFFFDLSSYVILLSFIVSFSSYP